MVMLMLSSVPLCCIAVCDTDADADADTGADIDVIDDREYDRLHLW
jgi:hypothetical protein